MTSLRPTQFFLKVAVPSPLRRLFEYLPPEHQPLPLPGMRIRIPFGSRILTGIVISVDSTSEHPSQKLKPALEILDTETLFPTELLSLYQFAWDYYLYPPGLSLLASLPKALRAGKPVTDREHDLWQLSEAGRQTGPAVLSRAPIQAQAFTLLKNYGQLTSSELTELLERPGKPVLARLAEKNLVEMGSIPLPSTDTVRAGLREKPLALNDEQQAAYDAVRSRLGQYQCALLEGITGSGKTEIYLQLIHEVLQANRQVLVLVPEISLTPQVIRRFSQRFACLLVCVHSGMTDRQRLDAWRDARTGAADIIIGTRSAVFTPLSRPGLIIVDEEHDDSYKQQEGFRYSARDLSIWRAHQLQIPVVLGSATPSLESLQNALRGRYALLQLGKRAGAAIEPALKLVDLRQQKPESILASTVIDAIRNRLAGNEQVLVFLNRRGYSPLLLCAECGWIAECSRCERSFTLHQQPAGLRCHHCETGRPIPRTCDDCGSSRLQASGAGTERTEDLLADLFPDYPVIRIDRDSTRQKHSLEAKLQVADSGIPCILVGTQMLAKGHHFPQVTLVVVVDADSGLFSADFRAQENTGQLLMQVAGRSGRSTRPGAVLIQTWHPTHPSLQQLLLEGYGAFARKLLEDRRNGQLPPFTYCILLRAEAARADLPMAVLDAAKAATSSTSDSRLHMLGPIPSPVGKKAGRFRAQLMLLCTSRLHLHESADIMVKLLEQLPEARKVRWHVDVDPVDFS